MIIIASYVRDTKAIVKVVIVIRTKKVVLNTINRRVHSNRALLP